MVHTSYNFIFRLQNYEIKGVKLIIKKGHFWVLFNTKVFIHSKLQLQNNRDSIEKYPNIPDSAIKYLIYTLYLCTLKIKVL